MTSDIPDFIGSWAYDPVYEIMAHDRKLYFDMLLNFPGRFHMHILKRNSLNGTERLEGIIVDDIGSASFEGELSASEIRFTKKYDVDAISRGGAKKPVEYMGKEVNEGVYVGKYTVDGVSGGRPSVWQGDFIMIVPFDPRQN